MGKGMSLHFHAELTAVIPHPQREKERNHSWPSAAFGSRCFPSASLLAPWFLFSHPCTSAPLLPSSSFPEASVWGLVLGLANALPRLPGNSRQGSPRRLRQALGPKVREKETPREAWPGWCRVSTHTVVTGSRKRPQSNSRLHGASRSWGPGRTSAVQSASDCEGWGRVGEPGKAGPGASLGGWPCPSSGPASPGKGHVARAQARPLRAAGRAGQAEGSRIRASAGDAPGHQARSRLLAQVRSRKVGRTR